MKKLKQIDEEELEQILYNSNVAEILLDLAKNQLIKNDWFGFLCTCGRECGFIALYQIAHLLSNKEYWRLVAHVWTMEENQYENQDEWLEFFTATRPGKKSNLMAKEETRAFAALPDIITLYRGAWEDYKDGMSWTTKKEVAHKFAHRIKGKKVYVAEIEKEHALAYFLGREEFEIVVNPYHLMNLREYIPAIQIKLQAA